MEAILNRIKSIMKQEDVSPSALADKVGISRPLMSHVMSGRNKPSLQLVIKILEHYPKYTADWLLLGKEKQDIPAEMTDEAPPKELKSEPAKHSVQNVQVPVGNMTTEQSDTEQVMIFYRDRTYRVYKPR